jgi:hypothetical protein
MFEEKNRYAGGESETPGNVVNASHASVVHRRLGPLADARGSVSLLDRLLTRAAQYRFRGASC